MLISGLGLELECRSSVQDHDLGRDNCFYILILINIKPKWPKERKKKKKKKKKHRARIFFFPDGIELEY